MALRVVVLGAGAVGSVAGGWLSAAGHDVLLVGRPAHMEAVARAGLEVDGIFGRCRARPRTATDVDRAAGRFDVALVAVKSHATAEVAAALARWSERPSWVVSLQNGLGNVETLERAVGRSSVLGGRVIFGAVVERPGAVRVTVCARPVAIGPLEPDPARARGARLVADALAAAGVPAEPVESVAPLLWEKVLYNCGLNPLGALHGLRYGEIAASDELRPLLDAAIDEGFAVARRAGVALRWPDAAAFREYFHRELLPPTAGHRSSMLQDLEAGRPTEVDAIGGAIVREGARLGVPTPVNQRLVAEVHAAERARRFRSPAGVL